MSFEQVIGRAPHGATSLRTGCAVLCLQLRF